MAARSVALALMAVATQVMAADLPPGFARLSTVAPAIRQDIRYAGSKDFAGRPLAGYEAPVCILRRDAAEALGRVEASLAHDGLTLVTLDCYRPRRAVLDILAWASARTGPKRAPAFPAVDRGHLVAAGYIAAHSVHSTGYAVDIALARIGAMPSAGDPKTPCTAPVAQRGDDGLLDFGTRFDCFDPRAWTAAKGLPPEAAANRQHLLAVMAAEGFRNYAREWWHFSYPGTGAAEDFPVTGSP